MHRAATLRRLLFAAALASCAAECAVGEDGTGTGVDESSFCQKQAAKSSKKIARVCMSNQKAIDQCPCLCNPAGAVDPIVGGENSCSKASKAKKCKGVCDWTSEDTCVASDDPCATTKKSKCKDECEWSSKKCRTRLDSPPPVASPLAPPSPPPSPLPPVSPKGEKLDKDVVRPRKEMEALPAACRDKKSVCTQRKVKDKATGVVTKKDRSRNSLTKKCRKASFMRKCAYTCGAVCAVPSMPPAPPPAPPAPPSQPEECALIPKKKKCEARPDCAWGNLGSCFAPEESPSPPPPSPSAPPFVCEDTGKNCERIKRKLVEAGNNEGWLEKCKKKSFKKKCLLSCDKCPKESKPNKDGDEEEEAIARPNWGPANEYPPAAACTCTDGYYRGGANKHMGKWPQKGGLCSKIEGRRVGTSGKDKGKVLFEGNTVCEPLNWEGKCDDDYTLRAWHPPSPPPSPRGAAVAAGAAQPAAAVTRAVDAASHYGAV